MKSLFNYLREMSTARSAKGKLKKKSLASLALIFCTWGYMTAPAQAEGSKNLYPQNATGFRANTEWRTNKYGPTAPTDNSLLRRTLLQVYAKSGEYILLGSSAVGVDNADILIYGSKLGRVGDESLSDLRFQCTQQRTSTKNINQGKIISRDQELAGPDTITNDINATPGKQVTNGYVPCYYKVPSNGIYYVVFYGPLGNNSGADIAPTGEINLSNNNNFNKEQGASVAAWDVTVRSSLTSTSDINGRLFTDYLTLYTGNNGRPMSSSFYTVTTDGYRYKTDLNSLDPNGFVIYGNDIGYYDRDGKTPLYHDVLGNNGNLTTLEGGTNFALPTHVIFFSNPQTSAGASDSILSRNIPLTPTAPIVNNLSYAGTAGSNNSKQNTGGDFTFQSNVAGIYEIVISRNGNNVDPTNIQNRVLRGKMTSGGTQTVKWDGKDNDGNYFPLGTNYPVKVRIHAGEYHFPLIDAENSTNGGPSFTLLNATNPLGSSVGFYDDRGYRTLPKDGEAQGVLVGTQGSVLCGLQPPSIPNSNPINGFLSTSAQRAFGANPGSNTNVSCTGSFGDAKGLDIWTYFPSEFNTTSLNIVAPNVKVSGTVYEDFGTGGANNNNNKFDSGEKTIGKVTVNLFKDDNDDGQPDGPAVKTIETDSATGAYQFTDVAPGRYLIQVDTRDTDIPNAYAIGTPNPIRINLSADLTNQNFGFNNVSKTCPSGSFRSEQTFLDFQNPTPEPGTTAGNYNVGAIYRFPNVATRIDALVEIKALNNATLTQIDVNNFGIASGFQPEVKANSINAGQYSVDFDIRFVQSATTRLVELRRVLATGIDIDGDSGQVREFSELGGNQFTSYAIDSNSRLTATELSPTRVRFESKTNFNLDNITINSLNQGSAYYDNNTQSINYRAGLIIDAGNGQNVANTRLTSLVFDCVQYNLPVTSTPNVILVKRITAINGNSTKNPNDNTVLNQFVDDTTSPQKDNDNSPKWPDNYLLGAFDAGKVKPNDEIEYTVYFLNIGNNAANNVRICDRITPNQDFQPDTYAAGKGIRLKLGTSADLDLTNANDSSDRAQLIAANGAVPTNCNLKGTNNNGTLQIDITGNTGSPVLTTMPGSTGKGTPNNSYGLFKFKTKVKP